MLQILIALTYASNVALGENYVHKTLADGSPIVGRMAVSSTGKLLEEYLGVPYAEPPVGKLRFRRPLKKNPWAEERYCVTPPNSCIQTPDTYFGDFSGSTMWNPNTPISEDCLYLNVWVPASAKRDVKPKTVMIWIYGGGFWSGTSSLDVYDPRNLVTEEDIIFVSMNYRVTAFGFLFFDNDEAPGNMGLLDQLLAMKWVQQNIRIFGGDPNDVTIFGESAGGASVTMHLLSPLSRNYFKRAITQSGAATQPWAMTPRRSAIRRSLQLAERCHCNVSYMDPHPDLNVALRCLLDADAELLREKEWITFEFCDFPWTPVVDGYFLIEDPLTSLRRGHVKPAEVLLGSNFDESMYFIVYHMTYIFNKEAMFTETEFVKTDEQFLTAVRNLLPKVFVKHPIALGAIMHEYTPYELPVTARARQDILDKMLGDYHFVCGVNLFASYYTKARNDVYMYYFKHRSSVLPWPEWMGVLHGYEVQYAFGEPLNATKGYTESEKMLSRRVMRYWANFARTGNPNGDGSENSIMYGEYWPKFTFEREEHMVLDVAEKHAGVGNGIRRRYCTFWQEYLPSLISATGDFTELETKWKQQFDRWMYEYVVDWKYQFERYASTQESDHCSPP